MSSFQVFHRGSAHTGSRTRAVLYATFLGKGALPFGQTFAIDSELLTPPLGPLTLASLRGELEEL